MNKTQSVQELFDEINDAKDTLVECFSTRDMRAMVFSPSEIDRIFIALNHYKAFAEALKVMQGEAQWRFIQENRLFIGFMRDMLKAWASEIKMGGKPNEA